MPSNQNNNREEEIIRKFKIRTSQRTLKIIRAEVKHRLKETRRSSYNPKNTPDKKEFEYRSNSNKLKIFHLEDQINNFFYKKCM
jgi:hypothetical protein